MQNLDENQKIAVECVDNCVVSAGAGSGKTTVLSHRFLYLVEKGFANCDEILTLTFTKKAASEMYERIYKKLLQQNSKKQIEKFSDATICTFDSFCSQILKEDCIKYGLSQDFSIADSDEDSRFLLNFCQQVFQEYSTNSSVKFMSQIYSPSNLKAFFNSFGNNYLYLAREIDTSFQKASVKELFKKIMEKNTEEFCNISNNILEELKTPEHLEAVTKGLDLIEEESLQNLGEFLDNVTIDGRKERGKKEILDEYRESVKNLSSCIKILQNEEVYLGIYPILKEIENKYFSYKRSTGNLTFSDVSSLALDILKTNIKMRNFYKNRYKFIMVDEFQDNNSLQKKMLYLLGEEDKKQGLSDIEVKDLNPRKLFFVGDEKQSIYRFRKADVSVFKALKNELTSIGGKNVELKRNYRTEPKLINDFNFIFERVMQNDGEKYEADFEKLETRKENEKLKPSFTLCIKPKPDKDSEKDEDEAIKEDAEAYFVASLIERMVNTDEFLIPDNDGKTRRPKYSDIAILLRKLRVQSSFEKALQIRNLPYCLQETRALFSDAVANDFYNVLQLLLFPDDRLSYLAFLRSPLCNLDEESIHLVLDFEVFDTEKAEGLLDCTNFEKFKLSSSKFNELKKMTGKVQLTELLAFIWKDWGYRYFLMTKKTSQIFLSQFDYFYNLAKQFDDQNKTLAEFLTYLRPLLGSSDKMKDTEILRENNEGVQIMTIHKAKGLEFPIVIVANTGSGSASKPPLLESFDSINGPIVLPNQTKGEKGTKNLLFYLKKDEETKKEKAELKRLLYVAMTRVENHLVVTGCVPLKLKMEKSKDTQLLGMLASSLNLDIDQSESAFDEALASGGFLKLDKDRPLGLNFSRSGEIRIEKIDNIDRKEAYLKMEKSSEELQRESLPLYKNPESLVFNYQENHIAATNYIEQNQKESNSLELCNLEVDEIIATYNKEAEFGTYVHRLLELIIQEENNDVDFMQVLEDSNNFNSFTAKEKKIVLNSAKVLVNNFLKSSIFEEIRSWKKQTEVGFFYCPTDVVIEGKIDLLAENENKILILDYKTDKLWSQEKHQRQIELYKDAISKKVKKEISCILFYLRDPDISFSID